MRPALFFLLLLVGVQSGRTPVAARPAFWDDARYRREVRLQSPRAPRDQPPLRVLAGPTDVTPGEPARTVGVSVQWAQDVTDACAAAVGVPITIQALWGRRRVLLPDAAGEARQVMEGLRSAFGGRWWKTGGTWVLARTLEEVRLTLLTADERLREKRAAYAQAFRSLRRVDWARLLEGEPVPLREVSPGAQANLRRATVISAFRRIDDPFERELAPDEQTLAGEMTVRFSGSGQTASLAVRGPGWSGTLIPFYHPTSGQLMWGVPPPR
jgi:hypothetical protein